MPPFLSLSLTDEGKVEATLGESDLTKNQLNELQFLLNVCSQRIAKGIGPNGARIFRAKVKPVTVFELEE